MDDSTSEDDDDFSVHDSDGNSELVLSDLSEEEPDLMRRPIERPKILMEKPTPCHSRALTHIENGMSEKATEMSLEEGNFVVVVWNQMRFPGMVKTVDAFRAVVDCVGKTQKGWVWPKNKDALHYKWQDIKNKINPPKLMKRGIFLSKTSKCEILFESLILTVSN